MAIGRTVLLRMLVHRCGYEHDNADMDTIFNQ